MFDVACWQIVGSCGPVLFVGWGSSLPSMSRAYSVRDLHAISILDLVLVASLGNQYHSETEWTRSTRRARCAATRTTTVTHELCTPCTRALTARQQPLSPRLSPHCAATLASYLAAHHPSTSVTPPGAQVDPAHTPSHVTRIFACGRRHTRPQRTRTRSTLVGVGTTRDSMLPRHCASHAVLPSLVSAPLGLLGRPSLGDKPRARASTP